MKHLYIISGLGADERVFQKIDFNGYKVTFIDWVKPTQNESLKQYALRLAEGIREPHPVLIGISFGGMLASEIAQAIPVERVILLASLKTSRELPPYYRFAGRLKLYKLLPTALLKQANILSYWLFGVKSHTDQKLFAAILKDTDPKFLRWAIGAILSWRNEVIPERLTHIHRDADHILPIRFITQDIVVKGGGHLMTLNKADELSSILRIVIG